jgi:hypothetical protein
MSSSSSQISLGWLKSRVTATTPLLLDQDTGFSEFSAIADLNGDGLPEMIFSGWTFRSVSATTLNPPAPVFVLTQGSDGKFIFLRGEQLQDLKIPGTGDPVVGDFNGDGIQDVFFIGFSDFPVLPLASTLLLGARTGKFEIRTVNPPIAAHSGDVGDIDGDGDLDIVVSNYHAIEQTANNAVFRQAIALVNDGTGNFGQYRTINAGATDLTAGSTGIAADFDGDGRLEFVFGDAKENATNWQVGHVKLMTVPGGVGEGSAFTGTTSRRIADGYFDREAFAGIQSNFDPEKSHEVETLVADLNGDGRLDIIMMSMLWSSGPDRFVPQILINQGNLVFTDETATRLPDFDILRGASFNPILFDINRDGYVDLILDGGVDYDPGTGRPYVGHLGADILLNDGTGRFYSVARAVMQGASDSVTAQSAGLPYLRDGGRMHFYGLNADGAPVWIQLARGVAGGQEAAVLIEHVASQPISTGPGGIDPGTRGAPGFNELYYLNMHTAARAAVDAGQYASGLDHYLAVGRAQGLAAMAPAVDRTPPALTSVNPLVAAKKVALDTNFSFIYSEPITLADGGVQLKTADGALVETFTAANATVSGSTLTLNPTADLSVFTQYVVELGAGAVKDLAGNGNTADSRYHFQTATQDSLYHFFVVSFAAAPGATYMSQLAEAVNFGLPLKQIVEIFTTKPQFTGVYPTTMSNRELATTLVNNIVKTSASPAARSEAINDIETVLSPAVGWSRGEMLFTVFGNLASKPLTDPVWGGTAKQFQNQLAVARYFTEEMGVASENLATLRGVIGSVTPDTDVSTPEKIVQIIGTVPPGG